MARKTFSRADRMADQLQRDLSALISRGLKDPRIGWVTITHVDVTRDQSSAKIYYTVMEAAKREITQEALDSSVGYLRNELSKSLHIYTAPQLHFIYDESIERGAYMSSLLNKVSEEDAKLREHGEGEQE